MLERKNPEFKMLADFKILVSSNPEVKILADLIFWRAKILNSRFWLTSSFEDPTS